MEANPYAAPAVLEAPPTLAAASDAEAIRRQYIAHEASVKSVGTLYLLGFIIFGAIGVIQLATLLGGGAGSAELAGVGSVLLVIAALQFFLGRGLRRLQKGARAVTAVFSAIGLIGFPIGTLINGYILYLLMSQKGQMVFSPYYQEIIAATPHVKYKTSIVVWILLGIFVAIILFGAIAIFVSTSR